MSAAIAAAEAGVPTTIIDDNPFPGGQIYRQPPLQLRSDENPSTTSVRGQQLLRRFAALKGRIELLQNATVWGLFPQRALAISSNGGWTMIDAERLVLATGAYEYVPPFPGWTLPGVMTPGGAQIMAKTMHVLPGKRVLLAGTGPFLLVVALSLARAGVEVVGIIEAGGALEYLRAMPALLAEPGQFLEGMRYLLQLKRRGIPVYRRHVVVEARGDAELREVVIARCDHNWQPDASKQRTIEVDTLCVGYGFIPRIELALMAGCEMRFAPELGGWIPVVDDEFRTTVSEVWVAGDGGGVAGAIVAEVEGELAGLSVAESCGALSRAELSRRRRPLLRRLSSLRRFRSGLDRLSAPRPGLTRLARADTIVCRCEELTRDEVELGIEAGGTDMRTLKVMTRLGMGACQGRMCWPSVARLIAHRTGKDIAQVGPISVRPPIVPISLSELAAEQVVP
jgi:NADPH-dependent 2,4-dienoyl-CoA reductase/sulfur reductase-like enzyme